MKNDDDDVIHKLLTYHVALKQQAETHGFKITTSLAFQAAEEIAMLRRRLDDCTRLSEQRLDELRQWRNDWRKTQYKRPNGFSKCR